MRNIPPIRLWLIALGILLAQATGGCSFGHVPSNYREIHRQTRDTSMPDLPPGTISADDINRPDDAGMTPLHLAAIKCQPKKVATLLSQGASIDSKDQSGATPLHLAAQEGCIEVTEVLLKRGAAVNEKDSKGRTPLRRAKQWRQSAILPVLENGGAIE